MSTVGKQIACRAAIVRSVQDGVTVEDVLVDPPKAGEVRVKIVATGVCHSDVHIVTGHVPPGTYYNYPSLIGHEGSGVVESVGESVKSVAIGDHVVVIYHPHCGECRLCTVKSSLTNLCEHNRISPAHMPDGTQRVHLATDGTDVSTFIGTGTLADYVVAIEARVAKIKNKDLDLKSLCLLACGVPTGFGSAVNIAQVQKGSSVIVFGLGTIGLAAVLGARYSQAAVIIGVDINDGKDVVSKKFGVTHFINPTKLGTSTLEEEVSKLTCGQGADFALECIGLHTTLAAALKVTAPWGRVVQAGLLDGRPAPPMSADDIYQGKVLTGGSFGGYRGRQDINKLVQLVIDGVVCLDDLITNTLTLKDTKQAFDDLIGGRALRTIVLSNVD